MTKPLIKIHNVTTDEVIEREMNETEYAAFLESVAQSEAKATAEAEAQVARQAVLTKLGLTAEEVAALLS
jgi:hypothetical protein